MNRVVVLAVVLLIGFVAFSFAQFRPADHFRMEDDFRYISDISAVFLANAAKAEKEGVFYPSDDVYAELHARLSDLQKILQQTQENVPLGLSKLTDDNMILLKNALACSQCGKTPASALSQSPPENSEQMKRLLLARIAMLQELIPYKGPISRDVALQIDMQMTYLRIVALAYLSPQ